MTRPAAAGNLSVNASSGRTLKHQVNASRYPGRGRMLPMYPRVFGGRTDQHMFDHLSVPLLKRIDAP